MSIRESIRAFRYKAWVEARKYDARINGYFWLPCPRCGDPFGGGERHSDGSHSGSMNHRMNSDGWGWSSQVVCPWCDSDPDPWTGEIIKGDPHPFPEFRH